jgi:CelD/BcsL family acetyltransferase involved in cellulose biosynthesis
MTVEIRLAKDDDAEEWDTIISQSPHGTIFHQWKWLKIAEKYTGSQLFPVIGMKGQTPVGIIPVFFQRKGPLKMVFSPPPYTSLFYLGPVFVGYDELKQEKREFNYIDFQNSVENFIINDLKANYSRISLTPALQDPRPYTWSGYTISLHFDYVVNIRHESDHLIRAMSKKQRQNLNRAKRRGITVELGGKQEYEKILDLMDSRYAQQGKNVTISREYYRDIYDVYKDNLKIFVGKIDDEIVTGEIDFHYRDTHYSWIGNPKPRERTAPSPNDLVIWDSIQFAKDQGLKYYVTMNAAGNERLHSYYASKGNPTLRAHFSMKKTTFLISVLESGYSAFSDLYFKKY